MRVLLDTNIIIPLEDSGRLMDNNLAEMRRLCSEFHWELLIHPMQYEDLARDKIEERRAIVESRSAQYSQLPSPPTVDDGWLEKYNIRQASDNDRVDNALLFSLYRNAVSYLITEDIGIHKKAKRAGCHERVVRLSQFLIILRSRVSDKALPPPAGLSEEYLHEIDVEQAFFDSLREGYEGFDDWYGRSAQDHRKAWCIKADTEVLALCIFKEECDEKITDDGYQTNGKTLKLCTLKVGEKVRGQKYGERIIFTAFRFAVENRITSVYLHTHGKEHELLIALCEEYGFTKVGTYNGDDVLIKEMSKPQHSEMVSLDYSIKYYPHFIIQEETDCFIVPIKPKYHEELFPDISDWSDGLFGNSPDGYKTPARTIKKAYLCNANTQQITAGDLLLFYRTGDRKCIEVVGVVEKAIRSENSDEILSQVSKRTVFSDAEINALADKECLVILFRLQKYLTNPVANEKIQAMGIEGPIQTIRKITKEQFYKIIQESQSNEGIIVD